MRKAGESRSVLVTGGVERLGGMIAACLRRRGWRVITSSHRPDAGADLVADLSVADEVDRLYAGAVVRSGGRLDALVNNAGLFVGEESRLLAVNFKAPQRLVELLSRQGDGMAAVVNVADGKAMVATGELSPYLKSKVALLHETRRAARAFAATLRVNAVAPGPVLMPTGVHVPAGRLLLARHPTGNDVAEAVAYLLEAEAVTGVVIPVDGGQSLLGEGRGKEGLS